MIVMLLDVFPAAGRWNRGAEPRRTGVDFVDREPRCCAINQNEPGKTKFSEQSMSTACLPPGPSRFWIKSTGGDYGPALSGYFDTMK